MTDLPTSGQASADIGGVAEKAGPRDDVDGVIDMDIDALDDDEVGGGAASDSDVPAAQAGAMRCAGGLTTKGSPSDVGTAI